jgi:hypothetical protein
MNITFSNGVPVAMNGEYSVTVTVTTTGTFKLQTRNSAATAWVDVPSTSKSASDALNVKISGEVNPVITGDATATAVQIHV